MTTITIQGIEVIDASGNVTAAGTRLMEMIHECVGMGCWHRERMVMEDSYSTGRSRCLKCQKVYAYDDPDYKGTSTNLDNPDYLTSLDDNKTLFHNADLSENQRQLYMGFLIDHPETKPWEIFEPHHHVHALAKVCEVECSECLERENRTGKCKECHIASFLCDDMCSKSECSICNATGKTTVLIAWVNEMEVK